jgi:hypothetical protein
MKDEHGSWISEHKEMDYTVSNLHEFEKNGSWRKTNFPFQRMRKPYLCRNRWLLLFSQTSICNWGSTHSLALSNRINFDFVFNFLKIWLMNNELNVFDIVKQIDKAYPRDFMQRGRVRVLLKRDDGTLCNSSISSSKIRILNYIFFMILLNFILCLCLCECE